MTRCVVGLRPAAMRCRALAARMLVTMLCTVLLTAATASRARAQSAGWSPRLQLDNDAYDFWLNPGLRPDEQYTNGVLLSLETARAPWWGSRYAPRTPACADPLARDGACLSTVVSIAQDIYTPNLAHPPFSESNWESERPYAAWLRVAGTARVISATTLREVEVAAGVTGTPALGRPAQSIAHAISRPYTVTATGWETQVGFEPGLLAAYHETWLSARSDFGHRVGFDMTPYAGGTIGDILTEADAGANARIGYNLSHPWDPRVWRGRPTVEAFLDAGLKGEYVLEDFSLDGTLFGNGRHVQRVPAVREYELGAGVRYDRLLLAYRAITRGREYATGPGQHSYSSMIATYQVR